MALELSTLVFKVDTKQLTDAIEKTNQLSAAQKQLATAMTKGSGSAGASQQQKQTRTQQDLLTKLDNLYKDLAQGATRWEASQLRAARQMGVPLEAVREQLVGIRKLSQDPFDSAIGSVRSITQYFEQLQNRISLTNEGLILTAKQMREFSRIPFEVEGQMQAGGKDPKGADNGDYLRRIEQEERKYIDTARAANTLADAEKERANVLKQNAQASKFLATEMQRVDAVLAEMNNTFGLNTNTGERSAAMVAKYSAALQRAGVSGVEAAAKLETYRAKVQQIAMQDEKRAATRLSRALTPQISDVAVSVAGGMPLHLVIMQQGLQIRDLIAQSGVAAQTLQGVFKTAAADMVKSIGGTIAALGSLTFGAIVDAGGAINSFATKIFGMNGVIDAMNKKFPEASTSITRFAGAISGIVLTGFVLAAGALVYEYVKLIGVNNELARSLAVTGGVFGVSLNSSNMYVEGLTKLGASTREAIQVLNLMASSGKLLASQIDLVGKAAVDMERYGGVAIGDTVKAFDSLAKDPVKALSELAIKTGQVSPKTMELVRSLEAQGKTAEAAGVAVRALATQMGSATAKMQQDLHPLTLAWISFKHSVSEAWTGFGNAINRAIGANPALEKMQNDLAMAEKSLAYLQGSSGARSVTASGVSEKIDSQSKLLREKIQALKEALVRTQKLGEYEIQSAESYKKAESEKLRIDEARAKFSDSFKKKQAQEELDRSKQYLTQAEIAKRQKEIDKMGEGKQISEAAKQKSYELSIQEKLRDAYIQVIGKVEKLNDLEKAILDVRDDPQYKGGTPKYRAEVEKDIEQKRKLLKAHLDEASTQTLLAQIDKDSNEIKKKAGEDIAELYQKLTVHGEKYEKQLIAINLANMAGLITSDEELERLKALNLARNSNAQKYFTKEQENNKKTGQELDFDEEDMRLKNAELSSTERTSQLARIGFETKKQLAKEYNEFYLKETEILKNVEGQQQQDLLDANISQYERRRGLILAESELKKKVLSEEAQRQKNFDDTVKRGFESMGDALIDFAATGKDSFGDMIKQMLIDLAKLEMRLLMMKLYEGFRGGTPFGGGFTDVGGEGAITNAVLSSILGGKFAEGGNPPVGKVSLVGEAGPELFIPKQQGTIIPNHQLGGTKKVVNVNNSYSIQIDSRSDQAAIYAGVQSMLKQNNAQLVDQLQTGGYL